MCVFAFVKQASKLVNMKTSLARGRFKCSLSNGRASRMREIGPIAVPSRCSSVSKVDEGSPGCQEGGRGRGGSIHGWQQGLGGCGE